MVTVTRNKLPAPALQQGFLITTAAKAGVVKKPGAGAKIWVLESRANLTTTCGKRYEVISSPVQRHEAFLTLLDDLTKAKSKIDIVNIKTLWILMNHLNMQMSNPALTALRGTDPYCKYVENQIWYSQIVK